MKRCVLSLIVIVLAACGRGGDTEGGRETGTGPSGLGATTTANETTSTEPTEELARVQTAFCHDYLPLLAFTLDVGIVTGGDAIGMKNEDDVLFLVDVSRGILRQTKTLMTIYANSLADLGEEDASDVAARTATLADEIVRASDGQTLAAAIDPTTLDAVLPSDYCRAFISEEFGRGYFDGWLLTPRTTSDGEYLRGYRLGRAEGWRGAR